MHSKLETLRQISAGEFTVDEAAARHGVTPETVVEWSELFLAGAQARRRVTPPMVALLVCFGALGLAGAARAACNAPTFGNLIGVCADEPAHAGDHNLNLQKINARLDAGVASTEQLRADVVTKFGPLTTAGVTLQAPVRIGAAGCSSGEVVFLPSDGGAIDCRPLFGASNALITYTTSADLYQTTSGPNTLVLGPETNRVCFLSNAESAWSSIATGNGGSECTVDVVSGEWRLTALVNGFGATACRARCLVFAY